jgi:hypothetical protein
MSIFKKWWFYLLICAGLFMGYMFIGVITNETMKPSIYDAPYSTYDNEGKTILFKNHIIESERLVEVNGYYESKFPLYGWEYIDNKMWIIGDPLTGFGVTKR